MTKKRYAGVTEEDEIQVTGLETKRSDWTPIAQEVQMRVLEMLLIEQASEEEVNEYVNGIHENMDNIPVEKFMFEKIVDCRKEFKAKTRVVKAWESLGLEVETTDYQEEQTKENSRHELITKTVTKHTYQCISPRGEVLMGIRWIMNDKGYPVGIPDDESPSSYRDTIGKNWYWTKQIKPVVERIISALKYNLGEKQKTLDGDIIYT